MKKNDIAAYFNKIAEKRDQWKKKNSYYHNDIKNFINFLIPQNSTVLEVGCGTGDIVGSLNREGSKGIDISPTMIGIAKHKYPHIAFDVADAEHISETEKYDYVIASDLVGFLEDIQQFLVELRSVTHEKSRVIITYPNFLWEPIFRIAEFFGFKMPQPIQNWVSDSDVENFLRLAGFESVKKGGRLIFPKYIPILSTVLNRYLAKLPLIKKLCLVNYVVARPIGIARKKEYSVSIVIPARNERGNIEDAIKRTPVLGSHTEIIFIEGHSKDGTLKEMERVKNVYKDVDIKVAVQDGKGKGDAVRKGFDMATGDILMILDADLTVMPEDLPKFYDAMADNKGDFINGTRLVYQLEDQSMRFLNILGNKFFSMMFSWLLDQRLKDTLCGTKVIWKKDYIQLQKGRSFFGDFDPFGDFDLLFGAAKLNLKIVDLPVRYQARTYGSTQISRFSHGWLLLKMCAFASKKIKFI
ncbi:MAG: hypothetical protein ACD_81C00089G0020 [uncultured bacterium]|uniref:Methyltransferase type 12 n=1 Tax=Candidatus Wolfebacteria bacterium GW2011_GWE2_44_13 TaxID=1619017 RepID=A0A0G1H9S3_9BACT|nr:MAG: hypothetical protein ACD_81C00089G0020 [uncultured bacterium]KKT43535.1 MAG: Methyltransferase type 12 [Candidatus Wolfebacteria bacterium GW2011_GWE2_44_13]